MQTKRTGEAFESYRKPKGQGSVGCAVCGESVVGRVVVTLQERCEDPDKDPKDADRYGFSLIDSRSGSFCEAHAIEVYEAAKKTLPLATRRLPVGPLRAAVLASDLALADTGGGYRNRTVDRDLAVRVCAAIGRSLADVFGVVPEVCAGCGDELVGSPDGLCGFCREERAGVAA